MKDYCCFELAKKLKNLGVKQESLFYWHFTEFNSATILQGEDHLSTIDDTGHRREFVGYVSAFTVAELGEMLPEREETDYRVSFINIHKNKTSNGNGTWTVKFVWRTLENQHAANDAKYITYGDNLADALAKMLVYLLENGLITL